jgi:integrase
MGYFAFTLAFASRSAASRARRAWAYRPSAHENPRHWSDRKGRKPTWVEVRRLCKKAGVPVVGPHSLRGWMTSTAVAAGELPEVVAKGIDHASRK